VGLLAAACGDDSGSGDEAASESSEATTTTEATEEEFSTGDVQITLRWPEAITDAIVRAPGDEIVSWFDLPDGGPSPSGARIEGDETGPCGGSGLASNTYWPDGEAPSGDYRVLVKNSTGCGDPIDYELEVKVLGEVVATESGTLAKGEAAPDVDFVVP